MVKYVATTFSLLLCTLITLAQADTVFLKKEVGRLSSEIQVLKAYNSSLDSKLNNFNNTLKLKTDSLQNQVSANTSNIQTTANKLGIKIDQSATNANKKIDELDSSISKSSLYWIIGFLVTAFLFATIYFLLRKKISDGNSVLDQQISSTKKALEEEGIKLDTKLAEVLETQLKILNVRRTSTSIHEETDHSLALKVADEIVRIQKNLSNMDANTKGLKQLDASVKRIQDNFEANGYEMVDLLGKPFDARIKVDAQFRPDDTLEKGQEIISRIIKPQVLFKGIMIQAGLVEVSQG
jgi:DNA anti-recombination protein RmuC